MRKTSILALEILENTDFASVGFPNTIFNNFLSDDLFHYIYNHLISTEQLKEMIKKELQLKE